jgi:hypothetical protein
VPLNFGFSNEYLAPKQVSTYPLVICYIAIENGHLKWIFPIKMVIFYSYVKLPEGKVKIKYYMWFPKKSYGLRMIYRYTPFLFPRG